MICLQGFARRRHTLGLPAASIWTRWEGHDRNRRDIELDVVARLDDGRMLTGDVKWSSRPVGLGVPHQLVRDLDDLGRSGLGWAKDALAPDRSAGYLYCSAADFTDEFVALAARDARNYLWTLADLYAPEAAMAEHPE